MEVSDQIIKVLDEIGKRFGLAIDWTQANIIPYVQQLGQRIVNYELWTSVVWVVLSLVFIIVSVKLFKKFRKNIKSEDEYTWFIGILECIFSIVGIIVFGIVITVQVFDIVTCLTLPEKVIFEFVKQYIN
jgi:Ca2+/Na+ antiporter